MLKDTLIDLFEVDIHKLTIELKSYENEENIWKIEGKIKNSAGNLCLHLIGNLRHFIGKILGNIEYERDRDTEFNSKGIPREEMIKSIEETAGVVVETFKKIRQYRIGKRIPYRIIRIQNDRRIFHGTFSGTFKLSPRTNKLS